MADIIKARVANKRDTEANWAAENPLLYKGEIAIVEQSPTSVKFKVGDGAQNFNALPYANDLSGLFTIRAALPATNPGAPVGNAIWETTTPGVYNFFLDGNGNPIVVNVNEYARFIDNGAYFDKIVVPFSTANLATTQQLTDVADGVFDLVYKVKPTLPAITKLIDKGTIMTGGYFYINAPPVANDWYVDMRASFDLARLRSFGFLQPNASGEYYWAIVQIDQASGVMNILAQDFANCVLNIDTGQIVEPTADNLSSAANRSEPNMRCYIALRNKTGAPLGLAPATGNGEQTWQYDGNTGALITRLLNTDAPIEVYLYDENTLQHQVLEDRGRRAIRLAQPPNPAAWAETTVTPEDGTILVDSGVSAFNSNVRFPHYGIDPGKVITVKIIAGSASVDLIPMNGTQIEGSGGTFNLVGGGAKNLQFDGDKWWFI